jgi:hypothetical protein
VCGSAAGATPLLKGSGFAPAVSGPAPGIPLGNELLEEVTVPAKTPFNSKGKLLKTQFRKDATYYFVASGTAVLPVGRSIDAIYCFNADPPTGGCPPAAPISPAGGLNLLWFSGKTFDAYSFSRSYGDIPGSGYMKYQPTHRYVYKMKAPLDARVMIGDPAIGDPSGNTGAFTVELYGPPPKTDRVKFDINIQLLDEPLLIHVRDSATPTPTTGTLHVAANDEVVVADGKHHDRFAAWVRDSDTPNHTNENLPHGNALILHIVQAELDPTPTTRELTLKGVVTSQGASKKACLAGDTAKIVLVDSDPAGGAKSHDSYSITWTSGICSTHNHHLTQTKVNREGERLRVDIFCYSPKRGYRKEVC